MVRYWQNQVKLSHVGWWLVWSILWVLSADNAFAVTTSGRVLRVGSSQSNIAISHPDSSKWQSRDRVCVIQLRSTIACGRIIKATSKGAIVKLDSPSADLIAGDTVVAESQATQMTQPAQQQPMGGVNATQNMAARTETSAPKLQQRTEPPVRKPSQITPPKAQLLDSVKKHPESDEFNFNLSAGTSISFSFFYPTVNFQYAIAPNWAVGLMPMGLFAGNSTASLTGLGGYATVNYYGQKYFRGLWVQAGAGTVYFKVGGGNNISESASTLAAIGTVGWRGYWDLGLNIGIAAGAQFIQDPAFTTITVESAGILPMVILDVGFNW